MVISFEGIDGSGKTTQVRRLQEYFQQQGKECVMVREPGGTAFGESVRNILLDTKSQITARTELMLFESARAELVERVIVPAKEQGKVVICDRFFHSTIAYQGYGRLLPLADIYACNAVATAGLVPDVSFYLHVSLEESRERMQMMNKSLDRMERAGEDFFRRVIQGFIELSDAEDNPKKQQEQHEIQFPINTLHYIDATLPIEVIQQKILTKITSMKQAD
jgi:dTMP kinase